MRVLKGNRFLHISDLHFFNSTYQTGKKDDLINYEIKCSLLDYISSIITEKNIDAIIISGDLELDSTNNLLPYLHSWLDKGSRVFIAFGEHDTSENRKKLISATSDLLGLYILDKPRFIEDESLNFCVYGMSCVSKQKGFTKGFNCLEKYTRDKPTIFLTHPCRLSINKVKELGCKYYAVGHIHKPLIKKIDKNIFFGRPGHIYSLWDGDGKAWPTGYIIGDFSNNSLRLSWLKFPIKQIIRLYFDPFKSKDNKTLFVIENCSFEQSKKITEIISGSWEDQGYRGIFSSYYDFKSIDVESFIKKVLLVFIDDIFVTPSDSDKMKKKYGYSRRIFTAKTLLKDEKKFTEFMDRSIKASNKTQ